MGGVLETAPRILHMEILKLFSKNCKVCSYLDPDEKKKFDKCYFKNGNELCPAKDIRITTVGKASSMAIKYKKAKARGDLKEQSVLLDEVSNRSQIFQKIFKKEIDQ